MRLFTQPTTVAAGVLVGWLVVGSGCPLELRLVASGPASDPERGGGGELALFRPRQQRRSEKLGRRKKRRRSSSSSGRRRCSQLFLPGVRRRLFTADSFALRSDLSAYAKFSHFDAVCGFASSNQNLCSKKIVSGITESYHSLSLQQYYLSGDPYHSFSLQLFSQYCHAFGCLVTLKNNSLIRNIETFSLTRSIETFSSIREY